MVHGLTLGGGGGGGFLVALTKEPHALEACRAVVDAAISAEAAAKVTYHHVGVDFDGICVDGAPVFGAEGEAEV